jgi:hypothetical protein
MTLSVFPSFAETRALLIYRTKGGDRGMAPRNKMQ